MMTLYGCADDPEQLPVVNLSTGLELDLEDLINIKASAADRHANGAPIHTPPLALEPTRAMRTMLGVQGISWSTMGSLQVADLPNIRFCYFASAWFRTGPFRFDFARTVIVKRLVFRDFKAVGWYCCCSKEFSKFRQA